MQKLPKFAVTLLALACTLGQAWADEQARCRSLSWPLSARLPCIRRP